MILFYNGKLTCENYSCSHISACIYGLGSKATCKNCNNLSCYSFVVFSKETGGKLKMLSKQQVLITGRRENIVYI